MKLQKFRFKKEFYQINKVFNIPGLVIFNGFGSDFKTFCCKNCGEIFVADNEYLFNQKTTIQVIAKNEICPKCKSSLDESLISYPENIFYNGSLLVNPNNIDFFSFEETELIETYTLT
ncbi:MAG: hypothetical protein V4548_06390 [Bacteroidota bacterium]